MNGETIDYEKDLKALLRLMMQLGEALKGRKGDELAVWAEPQASKAVGHAYTILFLFRGTHLEDDEINFVDHASILVVLRSLAESVLTFDYLLVEPGSEDEREFRYCSWALASIAQRQQFPALTQEAEEQLSRDKTFLATMTQRVQETEAFQKCSPKEQTRLLEGKHWRSERLTKSAERLFGGTFGGPMYRYLAAYGHSDYLSVLQIRDNAGLAKQRAMAEGALAMACVCISKLIEGYLALWPFLELVANLQPNAQTLVTAYTHFARYQPSLNNTGA